MDYYWFVCLFVCLFELCDRQRINKICERKLIKETITAQGGTILDRKCDDVWTNERCLIRKKVNFLVICLMIWDKEKVASPTSVDLGRN